MTTQVMSTAAMSRLACCRAFTFIQISRAVQARQTRGAAPRTLTSTCGAHGGDQAQASSTAADQGQPKPSLAKDPGTEAYGQVTAAQANFVRVRIDRLAGDGGGMPPRARLLCVVRGLLKKMKQHVLVGDRVKVVGVDWTDGRGMVEDVLPRTSQLAEPPVANVTHVLLVFSADQPPFQPAQATRYLVSAEAAGLPVLVVLNKADLVTEERLGELVQEVADWGYEALPVSVSSDQGMERLSGRLKGTVAVLAGPSGAGKSSIINALRVRAAQEDAGASADLSAAAANVAAPRPGGTGSSGGSEPSSPGGEPSSSGRIAAPDADAGTAPAPTSAVPGGVELQSVGAVSRRIGRGRHTTRNVTLLEVGSGGGLLADTPGFNQPDLALPSGELSLHFPDAQRRLETASCAFSDCQHLMEPGCAVREGWARHGLYADIHAELRQREHADTQRAAGKKKREGAVRYKSRAGGMQGAEALLEVKSHRRVSRRSVRQGLEELARDEMEAQEQGPPGWQ